MREPNIDFIATVEINNGHADYREYPVCVDRQLLVHLEQMASDDSKTILDLQSEIPQSYRECRAFDPNFLVPSRYDSAFQQEIRSPVFLSREEFRNLKDDDLAKHLAELKKPKDDALKNHSAELQEQTKEWPYQIRKAYWDRDNKRVSSYVVRVPEVVYIEFWKRRWNRFQKDKFVTEFCRYVASSSYVSTLKKNRIDERLHTAGGIRMYSTDTIGWTTYCYQITDLVKIRVDSNFGYGKSSYFHLSLLYRDIEIVPFSHYVKYRFANARVLMSHTRSFALERDSWRYAFRFVVDVVNRVSASPEDFENEYIWNEIEDMLDNLRAVMCMQKYEDELFKLEDEQVNYLGVRCVPRKEREKLVLPKEELLLLKAEKAIGALGLLERLRSFSTISDRVSAAISTIVAMIKDIIPILADQIKETQSDIQTMMGELQNTVKDLSVANARMLPHRMQIETLDKQNKDKPECCRIDVEANYAKEHPEFHELKNRICKLQLRHDDQLRAIEGRKHFLSDLETCYGVGRAGDKFMDVSAKLEPHLRAIEMSLCQQLSKMEKIVNIENIRSRISKNYANQHSEIVPLLALRDEVLTKIDGLKYCQVEKAEIKKRRRFDDV